MGHDVSLEEQRINRVGKYSHYRHMGIQRSVCSPGLHICKHSGSKPDFYGRVEKRRAKNKVARHTRQANRARR